MSLLEMMIVLAIVALVMGLVIGPKVIAYYHEAQRKTARLAVRGYADRDYPQWSVLHHERCPKSLVEIAGSRDLQDPWGTDYKMYCGTNAPAPDVAFGAASFGEDTRENTDDDIRSWERGE